MSAHTAPAGSRITQNVAPPMSRGPSTIAPPSASAFRALFATSFTCT
jgi:hypothetical protein